MNLCPWPNCPETFDDREEVKDHVSSSHLDYFPYRCARCRVMFPSRSQVDFHWMAEHDDGPASVACCISRTKEQRLYTLLSSQTVEEDQSRHAITVTAESTNAPIDMSRLNRGRRRRRSDESSSVHVKENSAFDEASTSAIGEFEVAGRSPEDADSCDSSAAIAAATSVFALNSLPSSSLMLNGTQSLPSYLIDHVRDLTAKRQQLVEASIEHRLKYFVSQLAIAVPDVSLIDVQSSFRCAQKSTLSELLSVQKWPANAVLNTALQEFHAMLPASEMDLVHIVRNCIAHAQKIVNQHISRDLKQNQPMSDPYASTSMSVSAKKKRLERRSTTDSG